jgi:hypothetical protein
MNLRRLRMAPSMVTPYLSQEIRKRGMPTGDI